MAEAVCRDSRASGEIETESTDCQMEPELVGMVNALNVTIEGPEFSFPFKYRIESIPAHLRKVNEQAYTPMVISIGPIHHGDPNLQNFEKFKAGYLKSILNEGKVGLMDLLKIVRAEESRIYCCYPGASHSMCREEFLKVILVDAIFVLEFICRTVGKGREPADSSIEDQMIKHQMDFILCDLILLENQLPFFVLEILYCRIYTDGPKFLLIDLVFEFFKRFNVRKINPNNVKILHFTDLIRVFMLAQSPSLERKETGNGIAILMRSATQLHEAGVTFRADAAKSLLDITFDSESGELVLPCIELFDHTEALIRNVMAFEQYCFGDNIYVRDYCLFLDRLVNTTRDIDFLCDKGIILNYLGDSDAATSLVNKLNIHFCWSGVHPKHCRIFKELNDFYEKPWHKWKATLKHQYFSSPWRTASTIAAVILLVLTFVQTVCSIFK